MILKSSTLQVWVALLIAWLIEIKGPEDCRGVGPYYVAVGGLLGSFFLSAVCEVAASIIGFRGSLFETRKRAAIPPLIYGNGACILVQIAFNGYATHLLYTESPQCSEESGTPWDPTEVLFGMVWSTWAIIISLAVVLVVSYNMFPDYQSQEYAYVPEDYVFALVFCSTHMLLLSKFKFNCLPLSVAAGNGRNTAIALQWHCAVLVVEAWTMVRLQSALGPSLQSCSVISISPHQMFSRLLAWPLIANGFFVAFPKDWKTTVS